MLRGVRALLLLTTTILLTASCHGVPEGRFACGHVDCANDAEYCVATFDDTGGGTTYACQALPAGCTEGCPCFGDQAMCCTKDEAGQVPVKRPCPRDRSGSEQASRACCPEIVRFLGQLAGVVATGIQEAQVRATRTECGPFVGEAEDLRRAPGREVRR
jgi:hypothetical protein